MNLRGTKGLSLVELLIAAMLVSAVAAILLNAFLNAAKWIRPEPNVAISKAREKMEDLYEEVREDWWDDATKKLNSAYDPPAENVTMNGVVYTRDYEISDVAGRDYRKVRVNVQWPD